MVKYKDLEVYMDIEMSVEGIVKLWQFIRELFYIIKYQLKMIVRYKNISDIAKETVWKEYYMNKAMQTFGWMESNKRMMKQMIYTSAEWCVKLILIKNDKKKIKNIN